jgi:hypothetical protein
MIFLLFHLGIHNWNGNRKKKFVSTLTFRCYVPVYGFVNYEDCKNRNAIKNILGVRFYRARRRDFFPHSNKHSIWNFILCFHQTTSTGRSEPGEGKEFLEAINSIRISLSLSLSRFCFLFNWKRFGKIVYRSDAAAIVCTEAVSLRRVNKQR